MAHILSDEDLKLELREQAKALRASSKAFDQGELWEAKRLAATIYILVHDSGKNSKSLLGQLGQKPQFFSTAKRDGSELMPLANITQDFRTTNGPTFTAFLNDYPTTSKWMSFKKWYREPVFESGRLRLSRKNLIFTFRSQAGGAHVDRQIGDDAFMWLKRNSPIHMKAEAASFDGDPADIPVEIQGMFQAFDGPVPNGHFASMRQIAWEVDYTLENMGC